MDTRISKNPEETFQLGEELGRSAEPGLIVGLIGDLGAGKTQFIKGVARGLGITTRVHSPTFALLNEYQGGRLPCYHIDLYRLDSIDQIIAAGLEQYLTQTEGITLVEWYDRWHAQGGAPGTKTLILKIRTINEQSRELTYEGFGA
jgi:tRNA threonylcarbamoyladenosine biosynthesis protein TsaE